MRKGKMVKAQPMPDLNTEFSMETLGRAICSKRTDRGWRFFLTPTERQNHRHGNH